MFLNFQKWPLTDVSFKNSVIPNCALSTTSKKTSTSPAKLINDAFLCDYTFILPFRITYYYYFSSISVPHLLFIIIIMISTHIQKANPIRKASKRSKMLIYLSWVKNIAHLSQLINTNGFGYQYLAVMRDHKREFKSRKRIKVEEFWCYNFSLCFRLILRCFWLATFVNV